LVGAAFEEQVGLDGHGGPPLGVERRRRSGAFMGDDERACSGSTTPRRKVAALLHTPCPRPTAPEPRRGGHAALDGPPEALSPLPPARSAPASPHAAPSPAQKAPRR